MSQQKTVLILQGGGALGAYQAGVFQTLHEQGTDLDWVIGTSIGAINSALIAGNPPEQRLAQLQAFWNSLAPDALHREQFWPWSGMLKNLSTMGILLNGVNGFFKPRPGAAWDMQRTVPLSEAGFYDTSELKATLHQYVDFDYLNQGHMRLSICAVDLDDGQSVVFDNTKQVITAEHIMASGALPPGFPPVLIDGRAYWDGGVYSNSPLNIFLEEEENEDALCFMVDLWDPTESRPASIAEVMTRYKNIQYASRSRELLMMHQKMQNMQRAIRTLTQHLPASARQDKQLQPLMKMGCDHTVNVVHLIMKALPDEHYFKDVDFSASTIQTRWQAGVHDCERALRHKSWLQPLPPHAGLVIHELPQE